MVDPVPVRKGFDLGGFVMPPVHQQMLKMPLKKRDRSLRGALVGRISFGRGLQHLGLAGSFEGDAEGHA